MQLNDNSDRRTKFDDSNTNKGKDVTTCHTKQDSNMQGNESKCSMTN